MKIFLVVLISAIVLGGGHFYLNHKENPTRIVPYPYIFQDYVPENREDAQNGQILFIGDKNVLDLNRFIPGMISDVSSGLKDPLPWFNWGVENEGLHRSLAKARSMKKWPPIVFYVVGNSEFYEKKFNLEDFDTIDSNFKRYDDSMVLTAVMTAPILSKVIYSPPKYVQLGKEIKMNKDEADGLKRMAYYKLTYRIFEKELDELILLSRENKSTLVFVTAPINLDEPPLLTCENTQTDTLTDYLFIMEEKLDKQQYKVAYERLKELTKISTGNAKAWYLFGQAAREVGEYEEAKKALSMATSFDCQPWRANTVINSIVRKKAMEMGTLIVDFDKIVNLNYGRDVVFLNKTQPQNIYYERLMKAFKEKIKTILQI